MTFRPNNPATSRKTRGTSGESITEVLVAILVGALAGLMLAVAVTTATGITRRSSAYETHAAESVSQAERFLAGDTAGASRTGSVTVSFNGAKLPGAENGTAGASAYLTDSHSDLSSTDAEGYEDLLVLVAQGS